MIRGAITGYIDVAQLVLYAFWAFFACLILYLRGEDRREGYPLESEVMGRPKDRGFLLIPKPKTFIRANGETVMAPNFKRDERTLNARKVEPWPGAPLAPTGDPMLAGVGPGSYAERADHPEKTYHGDDLLAPLRVASNYAVAAEDISPIGFDVVGADGVVAGTIRDLWVDRSEIVLRYYEVALAGGGASVMLPVTFSKVKFAARKVTVQAILGGQFAAVPPLRNPDQITLLEEEKIIAYYGAGTLYATAERGEPLL
jgi:photosynthetic reaction center H subunit